MKKILTAGAFLFSFCRLIFCNDTSIQHVNGGNEYIINKSEKISIESELLEIRLYENFYSVSVDYVFRNEGETETLSVGFPETEYRYITKDIAESEKIRNFKTSVNNNETKYQIVDADILIAENRQETISKFYAKEIVFSGHDITKVHVEYDTSYNRNTGGGSFCIADYLIGSAVCWKNIDNLTLKIYLCEDSYYLDKPHFEELMNNNVPQKISVTNDIQTRMLELAYKNLNVELSTKVIIPIQNNKYDVFGLPWDYNFEFFEYPEYVMELLTDSQLRKARNLIYAFHGYEFKDKNLQNFFYEKPWYRANRNFSESLFNENEKKNLQKIIKTEKRQKLF